MRSQSKIFLLVLPVMAWYNGFFGQNEGLITSVGGWKSYTSLKNVIEITGLGDSIYAITEGGLIFYDVRNDSIRSFGREDGLSSVEGTAILADPLTRSVFIGYMDGMVNYFDADGMLHYITDIQRNEKFATKRINRLYVRDGLLYLATDFGIVVYDIPKGETRYSVTKIGTNPIGSPVNSLVVSEGKLWAAMGTRGVWSADITLPNLTFPGVWERESNQLGLPEGSSRFLCATGDLLFVLVEDTIFQKRPGQNWSHSSFDIADWNYLNASYGNVYGTNLPSSAQVLYPDSNIVSLNNGGTINSNYIHTLGYMLLGDRFSGLQIVKFGLTGISTLGSPGPRNNRVVDLAAHKGELYIAPKGRVGSSARSYDKSGIPYFSLHNGGWKISDHRNGALTEGDVYQDFYKVAIDPQSGRCMVGSWGEGMVEMLHGQVVRTYNATNSGLTGSPPNNHLISGLQFDNAGNLWISLYLNPRPLNMLSPDGQWLSFQSPVSLNAFGLMADELGNKWIIDNGVGIVVFNDNFTPDNLGDDRWLSLTTALGKGGLPNSTVYCIAQDHDLQIWIGTSEGVAIIYDPTLLWTSDFQDAACPIIEGYCLFRDQQVNDIVVDGYNRKWIATENGAFLVSMDGTEVLKHFTKANSPLLDDAVQSIAIDAWTGEVFFGTAKGTIGYVGDAIDGRPNTDDLYAYPNPAILDQNLPVMIKGMRRFSKVKITSVSGRLVRELESHGGEVPWDLRDAQGSLVAPGIYLAIVADDDGRGTGITKVAVLENMVPK